MSNKVVLYNGPASEQGSRTRLVLPGVLPGWPQVSGYGMLRQTLKQTLGGACTLGT